MLRIIRVPCRSFYTTLDDRLSGLRRCPGEASVLKVVQRLGEGILREGWRALPFSYLLVSSSIDLEHLRVGGCDCHDRIVQEESEQG